MKSYLDAGVRIDGRGLLDYRQPILIETNISENAEGSARVKIGETEVVAGVKLAVGTPFADGKDQGVLITGAELLPLSSPEFESGPPGGWATEVARVVDRGIRESKAINMKKLCIREGELVWMIYLDIYTINDAGNLIDASALAAVAALKTTVFPKLDGDSVMFGEFTNVKLPLEKLPITCTVFKLFDQFIIDAISDEEKLIDARISVSFGENGIIHAMQKGGETGLTIDEIDKMINLALEKTKMLRDLLKKAK